MKSKESLLHTSNAEVVPGRQGEHEVLGLVGAAQAGSMKFAI